MIRSEKLYGAVYFLFICRSKWIRFNRDYFPALSKRFLTYFLKFQFSFFFCWNHNQNGFINFIWILWRESSGLKSLVLEVVETGLGTDNMNPFCSNHHAVYPFQRQWFMPHSASCLCYRLLTSLRFFILSMKVINTRC